MLLQKLYVRIWLAVVLAVAVLTLLVGWAWRMTTEPPLRDVVVRNANGDVIGNGHVRFMRSPALADWTLGLRHPATGSNSATSQSIGGAGPSSATDALPGTGAGAGLDDSDSAEAPDPPLHGRFGEGPEFVVRMQDGQMMHLHLPRPPQSSWRAPFGFFWTLGLVAVAVALATYPIVRRLTRRLEALQNSVEQWGDGKLSVRVPIGGNDEVGFLASRFNHAAQRIEALVKAQEDLLSSQKSLLANASHELRSPLTRIRMGIELLGSSPGAPAKAEIARNIAELDQLVDEILLASRLDAKEADLGTVEPVDLVGLCAEECAHNSASLHVAVPVLVVPGVAKLLRRAVRNLLENANRYGAGEVGLDLREEGGFAVVAVSDAGPGVPTQLQSRVFEPFYRLPGASEREGGVGLGLALVRSIALRHGGNVSCGSSEQGGARFTICLPIAATA
jgi:signal transduction histidine kinase